MDIATSNATLPPPPLPSTFTNEPDIEDIVITKRDTAQLRKAYYEDHMTVGRDPMFYYLAKKYPDGHPTKRACGKWLKNQELQQLYARTRKGGLADHFIPTKPWQSVSVDLIDFNNKPVRNYRYILVVVDNFSRYMYTEPLVGKSSPPCAKGMRKILKRLKAEFNAVPGHMLCDDGGEFKGEFMKLLEEHDIRKQRTLGGHPETNGLVERSNGKLKMLLSKNKEIHLGTWLSNLKSATKAFNQQFIRTTKFAPEDAVKFTSEEAQKMIRANVRSSHKDPPVLLNYPQFEVGSYVRVKLAKSKLGKESQPSWSDKLYQIASIIPKRGPIAAKYRLKDKPEDYRYARNDIMLVNKDLIERIPKDSKAYERRQRVELKEQETVADRIGTRVGRGGQPTLRRSARVANQSGGLPPPPPLPPTGNNLPPPPSYPPPKSPKRDVALQPGPAPIDDSNTYIIGRFLKKKRVKTSIKYLVKWQGYPTNEATWEDASDLRAQVGVAVYNQLVKQLKESSG